METIIVKPKNAEEAKEVLNILKRMKVKTEVFKDQKKLSINPAKNGKVVANQEKKAAVFSNSFGMWKDADITTKSIRDKAWRKKI